MKAFSSQVYPITKRPRLNRLRRSSPSPPKDLSVSRHPQAGAMSLESACPCHLVGFQKPRPQLVPACSPAEFVAPSNFPSYWDIFHRPASAVWSSSRTIHELEKDPCAAPMAGLTSWKSCVMSAQGIASRRRMQHARKALRGLRPLRVIALCATTRMLYIGRHQRRIEGGFSSATCLFEESLTLHDFRQ